MRKLPSINEIELLLTADNSFYSKPDELKKLLSEFEFTTKTIELSIEVLKTKQNNCYRSMLLLESELKILSQTH